MEMTMPAVTQTNAMTQAMMAIQSGMSMYCCPNRTEDVMSSPIVLSSNERFIRCIFIEMSLGCGLFSYEQNLQHLPVRKVMGIVRRNSLICIIAFLFFRRLLPAVFLYATGTAPSASEALRLRHRCLSVAYRGAIPDGVLQCRILNGCRG